MRGLGAIRTQQCREGVGGIRPAVPSFQQVFLERKLVLESSQAKPFFHESDGRRDTVWRRIYREAYSTRRPCTTLMPCHRGLDGRRVFLFYFFFYFPLSRGRGRGNRFTARRPVLESIRFQNAIPRAPSALLHCRRGTGVETIVFD